MGLFPISVMVQNKPTKEQTAHLVGTVVPWQRLGASALGCAVPDSVKKENKKKIMPTNSRLHRILVCHVQQRLPRFRWAVSLYCGWLSAFYITKRLSKVMAAKHSIDFVFFLLLDVLALYLDNEAKHHVTWLPHQQNAGQCFLGSTGILNGGVPGCHAVAVDCP